jgi:hypothetical protein
MEILGSKLSHMKKFHLKIWFTVKFALYIVLEDQLCQLAELASLGVDVPEQDEQVYGDPPPVRGVVDVSLTKVTGEESLSDWSIIGSLDLTTPSSTSCSVSNSVSSTVSASL